MPGGSLIEDSLPPTLPPYHPTRPRPACFHRSCHWQGNVFDRQNSIQGEHPITEYRDLVFFPQKDFILPACLWMARWAMGMEKKMMMTTMMMIRLAQGSFQCGKVESGCICSGSWQAVNEARLVPTWAHKVGLLVDTSGKQVCKHWTHNHSFHTHLLIFIHFPSSMLSDGPLMMNPSNNHLPTLDFRRSIN